MAKRALGLGKSQDKKNKKKKSSPQTNDEVKATNLDPNSTKNDQVTIRLSEGKSELEQMWLGYAKYNKILKEETDNAELTLNGMIHECDRILRKANHISNAKTIIADQEKDDLKIDAEFYCIYGLALAELAYYQGKDEYDEDIEYDEEKDAENRRMKIQKIGEFFSESLDRIEMGLSLDLNSKYEKDSLNLAKLQILTNQIPLQYISTMDINSNKKKYPNIAELLKMIFAGLEGISKDLVHYDAIMKEPENSKFHFDFTDYQQFIILDSLDDLIDMIENFGLNDDIDDVDSDDDELHESSQIQLSKKHPLFETRNNVIDYEDKLISLYKTFLKRLEFINSKSYNLDLSNITNDAENAKNQLLNFYFVINEKVGQIYLKKADLVGTEYTTLVYGEDDTEEDKKSLDKQLVKTLQVDAVNLYRKALGYLKKAKDEEDPESWVKIAEVEISLGNIYELDSEDQENCYKKAEKILKKASRATNGKYDDILKKLLG